MKNNNFDKALDLAYSFLYLPIEETQFSPVVIQHPFFESAFLQDKSGMFNALEDEERYNKYINEYKGFLANSSDISHLISKVRKSYRLTFIYYLNRMEHFSKRECGNLLGKEWTSIETLTYDKNVTPKDVLSFIKSADKNEIMEDNELKKYNNLPDEIIVYRGCKTKDGYKACSWTLDQKKAEWFAERFNTKGFVYQASIEKANAIAYKSERSEEEVIVDFTKLNNVELIKSF